MLTGFLFFVAVFLLIGLWSIRHSSHQESEYLLAGQTVSPWLTALSAVATKYSGYMYIGLIGYIHVFGLSSIWLVFGFLFGDVIAFFLVHRKIRDAAQNTGALSFAGLVSNWGGTEFRVVRLIMGIITLIFLTIYAAAQLNAVGKALHVMVGWHYSAGAIIGALLILVYCFTGGLRASIWTDVAQSILMLVSMLILLYAVLAVSGGFSGLFEQLDAVSEGYLDFGVSRFGTVSGMALFAIGWVFNGIGVTGQPQVMVRFMALDDARNITRTGIIYFSWSTVFLASTFVIGLSTRLFFGTQSGFDPELALPSLAETLLPEFFVGVIIAGVFAASMSTTDSQVLSCSAVLSEDFKLGSGNRIKRISTLLVTLFALLVGLSANANVFSLVIFSWSALACAFGPLLIVLALGGRPKQISMLIMMMTGLVIALGWRQLDLDQITYEGFPGIVGALLVYVVCRAIVGDRKQPDISC